MSKNSQDEGRRLEYGMVQQRSDDDRYEKVILAVCLRIVMLQRRRLLLRRRRVRLRTDFRWLRRRLHKRKRSIRPETVAFVIMAADDDVVAVGDDDDDDVGIRTTQMLVESYRNCNRADYFRYYCRALRTALVLCTL